MITVAGGAIGGCLLAAPAYRGPVSDHFDGERFHNQSPTKQHGFWDFVRWQRTRDRGPWRAFVDAAPGPKPPQRVPRGAMRVTFVNHATVLVQMDGVNVLTDPIWSERASPVSFAGPKRHRPPGIRFEDLPPIDLVVVSHNHYDHMDLPTLQRLSRTFHPRIVTGLGNADFLTEHGVGNVAELDWWQSANVAAGVDVAAVPAQHFSQRGLGDRDRTLWAGYVVTGPAGAFYFAGDTGFGPHFQQIRERFGSMRLAVLPIGAFRPEWFMAPVHISPGQALEAHRVLGARTSVGMHFGTFALADDGQDEPPARIRELLAREPNPDDRAGFRLLDFGEGRDLP